MTSWSVLLGILMVVQAKPAARPAVLPETAADAVTLRDGTVVLGQVTESAARGPVAMYVRRAWARANLAEWSKRWEIMEAPAVRRATQARRERLTAWRRERVKEPGGNDRISAWLDRELDRLAAPAEAGAGAEGVPSTTLMTVNLNRGDVKAVVKRPKATARMFRQGWLSGFRDVETMKPADLKEALEGRGFAVTAAGPGDDPAPVALDRLLPIQPESDEQWLIRRAATEVSHDSGLRFIQIQNMFLPEPGAGEAMNAGGALAMVSQLTQLLGGEQPADPRDKLLREVAARGRVGAIVTQQEMSPGLVAVRITIGLCVRNGARWSSAGSKTATIKADAVEAGAGDDLAQDPQVGALFKLIETFGLGVGPDLKQKSLNIGAATRQALGMARGAFAEQLAALALPIDGGGDAAGADRAKPGPAPE